jgi:N,N'-diacetyllegionaminate synthase
MKKPILIIAEAGVNHNGDITTAKRLVDVAADAGADIVKFQTFSADSLATHQTEKADYQRLNSDATETQYQMLSRLELSKSMHYEIIEHCNKRNIEFLSTGFDIESINFLMNLGIKLFKIPSGEITNLPYLQHIGQFKLPIIMSTGMATMLEIEEAINVLEKAGTPKSKITVLHCTTEYPASINEVNLRAMQSIKKSFDIEIGYSDHTLGIEVSIAAAAMGATVIEKHFTLDKNSQGPDHMASLEPHELKSMIDSIRNIEDAMGNGIKCPSDKEKKNMLVARKSIVASKDIMKNEIFTTDNLTTKRPGTGISPMKLKKVIGKTAIKNFSKDEIITIDNS